MFALGPAVLEMTARRNLRHLARTHHVAEPVPAVSAQLDQHAAAVRDILALGTTPAPAAVLLAGYARGLLDHARDTPGFSLAAPADWCAADWLQLRLAAVVAMAGPWPVVERPGTAAPR
ncbi:DUF6401 family natural product biosynthesis protein [Nocardia thailandica]|uniref:DUF6401 family natural product biosynthesis protein n=1 Tax=Nocardia thailandica TaxID=257275 RepID=A0ABW6PSR3_9NOCA|nr:DUF6401 family natural product biosynthesis protein [Nocardia thailandica]